MEQDNNGKEIAKLGAKVALKAATSPIKAVIIGAIGVALPYILIGALFIIVILGLYFGTMEQIDEVLDGSHNVGEILGNAVSLHGFKTTEDVEKDEEKKFFEMLDLYEQVFVFDNYDVSLLTQTLLYEGSYEERVYLSENLYGYNKKNNNLADAIIQAGTGVASPLYVFIKNLLSNFQRGFFTSYSGQSPFLKANKNLFVNAVALKTCKDLTGGNRDKVEQCYKGYLIAEYNVLTDYLIDCTEDKPFCNDVDLISTDVEPGFLVLENNFFGEITAVDNTLKDFRNDIITRIFDNYTIKGSIIKKYVEFEQNLRDALTLKFLGRLADSSDKHFYYDGYIVKNLKEEYKVYNNSCYDEGNCTSNEEVNENMSSIEKRLLPLLPYYDKNIIEKERLNRRDTSTSILDFVDSYFELTYGNSSEKSGPSVSVSVSEKNYMVSVNIDGQSVDISFQEYVSLLLIDKYGDKILTAEQNILEAAIIEARTNAYLSSSSSNGSFNLSDNSKDYLKAYEIYNQLTSTQKANLSKAFTNTSNSVIKDSNGNLNGSFDLNINNVSDGDTASDIINNQGGIVDSKNIYGSPFPTVGNIRNYLSAIYGYDPTDTVHTTGHGGTDIALGLGTDVYSASGGTVIAAYNSCPYGSLSSRCGPDGYHGYGNIVVVQSADSKGTTYYTYYAHMGAGTVGVNVGDTIETGQYIGQIGSSGQSSGPHLHFEVRYGGNDYSNRKDPLEFYGL